MSPKLIASLLVRLFECGADARVMLVDVAYNEPRDPFNRSGETSLAEGRDVELCISERPEQVSQVGRGHSQEHQRFILRRQTESRATPRIPVMCRFPCELKWIVACER